MSSSSHDDHVGASWGGLFPTFRSRRRLIWIASFITVIGGVILWLSLFVDWHRHTTLVDGVTREYLLFAPPSRDQELKPLVLAYHGFSGNARRMAEYSKLRELAAEKGFYVAFIEGDPTWHSFIPYESEVSPDIAFFDRLRSDLLETHPIDPNRIYAVGMSKGGEFVFYLAQKRSTQVAAIVSQGACVSDAVVADRPFPVMIIVGTKDGEVRPDRFPRVPQAFRDRGHMVQVLRPENVGHSWYAPLNEQIWDFLSACDLRLEVSDASED
ncbi:MAG: alpha/beta hydrolase family esterase [Aeoliella sp.]